MCAINFKSSQEGVRESNGKRDKKRGNPHTDFRNDTFLHSSKSLPKVDFLAVVEDQRTYLESMLNFDVDNEILLPLPLVEPVWVVVFSVDFDDDDGDQEPI